MRAAEATRARARGSAGRIARDVCAIMALAAERAALHVQEGRRARAAAPPDARGVRWNATWAAAAVGAAASLPSGPVLGVAASALEAGLLVEIELRAVARLLAIGAGDDPVFGASLGSDARRTMFRAGVRKAAVLIAEHAAHASARLVLKGLGLALPRLGLRAVIGPAAPVVGAAWSAAWNALEMYRRLTPAVQAAGGALARLSGDCADPGAAFAAFPAIASA